MNCPQCGDDNWRARYMAAVNQPCDLERKADGTIEASFSEPGEIVEEQPTESYACVTCGYLIPAAEEVTE